MGKHRPSTATALIMMSTLMAAPTAAQRLAKPSGTQKTQEATMADVPRCSRKLGTVSVMDGDDPSGWTQFQLSGPQKLIKVLVQRSGCFNLVDRGSGLSAAQRERNIGGGLGLQRGSNVGQGQIKAADYVLIAEVQASNRNSGGGGVAGGIGGLIGGRTFGGLLGGIGSRKMEANTVLSLTNVRTTETIATVDGYAAKNSLTFGAGGGGFFGGGAAGLVGGGYDNTDIGRIVTLAFIQAYSKMVTELGLVQPGAVGTAEAAPAKTFTTQGAVAMRAAASASAKVVRTLPAGSVVYPTGTKNGLWWEVADENDNVGWVINTRLAPSMAN
ncbi:CsgG/HfaB family protein [Rhizorhabdus argentea]|uniref:CsgG/HfaB family protein n=1 Tax=Rhizorhabdus argentea TaxID=1387174 RepID=UPI0030EEBEBA